MFLKNKYSRWYAAIVSRASVDDRCKRAGYFERHHIVPRGVGGSNERHNRVLLTAREHFVCHLLLCRMFPERTAGRHKMLHAFMLMKGANGHQARYMNAALYDAIKREYAAARSLARSGKKLSIEHRAKIAASRVGRSIVTAAGRVRISELAKARKRRPFTEQERRNIGAGMKAARERRGLLVITGAR